MFRRWASLLLLAAAIVWPSSALAADLRIDFIAVGQGDAALVTSPTGKTVLIDGGPRASADALTTFLRGRVKAPIDLVLLTHRHDDHFGGLKQVAQTFGIRMFMDAPIEHLSPAYEALLKTLEARKVPVRTAERGRTIDLGGGATVTLLSPPDPPIARARSKVNANSVIARLDYRGLAVLFAAEEAPQLPGGEQRPWTAQGLDSKPKHRAIVRFERMQLSPQQAEKRSDPPPIQVIDEGEELGLGAGDAQVIDHEADAHRP